MGEFIGKNIFNLRKAKGITQQELASQINYSDKVISKWERGICLPDINALNTLADFFEVSIECLVEERQQEQKPCCQDQLETDNKFEYFLKQNKNRKHILPMQLLHIILMIFSLTMFFKVLAIYNEIPFFVWSYLGGFILSLAFALIAIVDVILLNLKVDRKINMLIFFVFCVVGALVVIIEYLSHASASDDGFSIPIYVQLFSCIALFAVGYCVEHLSQKSYKEAKEKALSETKENTGIYSPKPYYLAKNKKPVNKKQKIGLSLAIILMSIVIVIMLAFPFFEVTITTQNTSYSDSPLGGYIFDPISGLYVYNPPWQNNNYDENLEINIPWVEGSQQLDKDTTITAQASFYDSLKDNVMFILALCFLIIILVWDIVSFIFSSITSKSKSKKLLKQSHLGIIMLISSLIFFIVYLIGQAPYFGVSQETMEIYGYIINLELQPLWGLYVSLTAVISLTVLKVILAIMLINNKLKKILH